MHQLGSDDNDIERIKFLGREPAESARLLVLELHPVDGVRIMADEHSAPRWHDTEHVVWCLRALRSLTGGMEFRAKTSHKFGDKVIERNRQEITGGKQYSTDGTVRFFGVWMSRDSLYLAPQTRSERSYKCGRVGTTVKVKTSPMLRSRMIRTLGIFECG